MHAIKVLGATIALLALPVIADAKTPATWDGLVHVKAKRLDTAYLKPFADFRPYNKVMLDPAEVAMAKDWQRDYNLRRGSLASRVSDDDVRKGIEEAQQALDDMLAKRFAEAGFEVVSAPGPDVLRLTVAIIDLNITAPDTQTAARARTYSLEAGQATLVIEARDSVSNQLMGRGVDRRTAGDGMSYRRTSVSNRADFEELFDSWARDSAKGLTELRQMSPVNTDGIRKK